MGSLLSWYHWEDVAWGARQRRKQARDHELPHAIFKKVLQWHQLHHKG